MEIHFGCAQARASRRMWCLAAREPERCRAHPAPPTPFHAATECRGTPEVERMTSFELVASTLEMSRSACLSYIRLMAGLPPASTGGIPRQIVKERSPQAALRSADRVGTPQGAPGKG